MLKFLHTDLCAFDVEWIPDPMAGRRRYGLSLDVPDADVVRVMYEHGKDYHPETNPRPYLKTPLCQVVSIAVAWWSQDDQAHVHSWANGEEATVASFLAMVGKRRPQLFSFNGRRADVPILLQRAMAHDLSAPSFAVRPNKPWEGVDYFDRYSGWHVDLMDSPLMEGGGSLSDLCAGLDVPGKAVMDGGDVADRWAMGDCDGVRHYNEEDAMRVLAVVARIGALMGRMSGEVPWHADVLARHQLWAKAKGAA